MTTDLTSTTQATGRTGADRLATERGALAAHLGEVIGDLKAVGVLRDEAWAIDDVRFWIEEARGVSFREFITSLSAQLPPGFPS